MTDSGAIRAEGDKGEGTAAAAVLEDDRRAGRGSSDEPGRLHDAFISYSHQDRTFAIQVCESLKEHGKSVWVDEQGIPPASRWADDLSRAIEASNSFVFVLSPDALASAECLKELDHAVQLNKRVIPLHLRRVEPSETPEAIAANQFVPARGLFEDDYAASLERLFSAIDTDLEWVREHTLWGQKAIEWNEHGRDQSFVLTGSELEAAESWLVARAGKKPAPTALQEAYVQASRDERVRRLRRTRSAVSVALIVAIALSVAALIERGSAISNQHAAQSRELAARAQASADPELGAQLAIKGLRIAYTSEAEAALRAALPNLQLLMTVRAPGPLTQLAVNPRGSSFVTGGTDGNARIWDTVSRRQLMVLRGPAGVTNGEAALTGVAFSPDGRLVVTASRDSDAIVWDATSGRKLQTLSEKGSQPLESAVFSPGSDSVLTASSDGTTRIWSLASGRQAMQFTGSQPLIGAIFSPDGTQVLTFGEGGARLWSATTGRPIRRFSALDQSGNVTAAAFAFAGGVVVTGNDAGVADVWSTYDGARLSTIAEPGGGALSAVAFSADGLRVLTGDRDHSARIWDAATGTQLMELAGHEGAVTGVAFSPAGNQILTSSKDGTARIWDAAPRALAAQLSLTPNAIQSVAFSSDGTQLVVGDAGGNVEVVNAANGQRVAQMHDPHGVYVTSARFVCLCAKPTRGTLDEFVLAASSDGYARVWSSSDGSYIGKFGGSVHGVMNDAAPAPTGLDIATAYSDGEAIVWHGVTAVLATVEPGSSALNSIAFNPSGSQLLTASSDGTARLYSRANGHLLRVFSEPFQAAMTVARFSPDGGRIVTGSVDGTARVWDVTTGRTIGVLADPLEATVEDARFSPDGRTILTTTSNGVGRIWDSRTFIQLTQLSGITPTPILSGAYSPNGLSVLLGFGSSIGKGRLTEWSTAPAAGLGAIERLAGQWEAPS